MDFDFEHGQNPFYETAGTKWSGTSKIEPAIHVKRLYLIMSLSQ
jgi:hypothetical protein